MSLIPTPRTDKNGFTSIRHMKPETAPSAASRNLPAVALPALPTAPVELTDEQLIALVDPDSSIPEGIGTYLDILREDNPDTLPYVSQLLTTGNERGREATLERFRTQLNKIANHYIYDSTQWRAQSEYIRSPFLEGELNKTWTIANLADELDSHKHELEDDLMSSQADDLHRQHQGACGQFQRTMDTDYWRGIIAIGLSGAPMRGPKDTSRFIWWAGRHDDLGAVIHLATERDTIDVDTLSGILTEYDAKSPIREGYL